MSNIEQKATKLEKVLVSGDLSSLTPDERVVYYRDVCESLGLNPMTKPFAYIKLNGKLTLYALKDCTEQLRNINGVSVYDLVPNKEVEGLYIVTAYVKDAKGRTDVATGAVNIANLKGEALANAIMKAETKAKRRATLSICGMAFLDETEVETIPGAEIDPVDVTPNPKGLAEAQVSSFPVNIDTAPTIDIVPDQDIPPVSAYEDDIDREPNEQELRLAENQTDGVPDDRPINDTERESMRKLLKESKVKSKDLNDFLDSMGIEKKGKKYNIMISQLPDIEQFIVTQ